MSRWVGRVLALAIGLTVLVASGRLLANELSYRRGAGFAFALVAGVVLVWWPGAFAFLARMVPPRSEPSPVPAAAFVVLGWVLIALGATPLALRLTGQL